MAKAEHRRALQQEQQRAAKAARNNRKHNKSSSSSSNSSSSNNNNNKKTNNDKTKKNSDFRTSVALSWVLRHGALDLGLTITPDGYVPVQEILDCDHSKVKCVSSLETIERVVSSNQKQRFKLEQRPACAYYNNNKNNNNNNNNDTILCIRANQGHSIKAIDANLLLTKLSGDELISNYPCIVHGTYHEPWKSIQRQGLRRMNRTHIHFASGLLSSSSSSKAAESPSIATPTKPGTEATASKAEETTAATTTANLTNHHNQNNHNHHHHNNPVISGMRKTCTVYIYLNASKCASDNLDFYVSDNGVILTAGVNNEGTVPPDYFSYVTDSSGTVLFDAR